MQISTAFFRKGIVVLFNRVEKKSYLAVILVLLVLLLSEISYTEYAFYGYVSIDGVRTNGISVFLTIADRPDQALTDFDSSGNPGFYQIGDSNDVGWFCLRALSYCYPPKRDDKWGIKAYQNSINININCHNRGPICIPSLERSAGKLDFLRYDKVRNSDN